MVAFIVILICLTIAGFIFLFEEFQKRQFVASYVDGQQVTGNYIGEETQAVLEQLKNPGTLKIHRYNNSLVLPDSQELGYTFDDMEEFKNRSKLKYVPNRVEWAVLYGVVKKLLKK